MSPFAFNHSSSEQAAWTDKSFSRFSTLLLPPGMGTDTSGRGLLKAKNLELYARRMAESCSPIQSTEVATYAPSQSGDAESFQMSKERG